MRTIRTGTRSAPASTSLSASSATTDASPRAEDDADARSVEAHLAAPAAQAVVAAGGAFGLVVALAVVQGGYFPAAWGWSAIALLWTVATALVISRRVALGLLEVAFVAALVALTGWIAASAAWSLHVGRSTEEVQRTIIYVAVALAACLLVRPATTRYSLAGGLLGTVIVSTYSLATRLFPIRFGVDDPVAGYRLAEPLGYWNALGIFAAMGALLALGFAIEGRSLWGRSVSAAALGILVPTLYFTFSRGAAVALALGLAAAVALTPRRLATIAKGALLVPLPLVAVLAASRTPALTHEDASLSDAADAGLSLTPVILLCAVGAGAIALATGLIERRFRPSRAVRLAFAAIVVAVGVAVLGTAFERFGPPWTMARSAHAAFSSPPPQIQGDLNKRLLSFSGNGRAELWSVAWQQWKREPLAGSGAGTYEQVWLERRERPLKVRDAHGLFIEMLAETGIVSVVLLAIAAAAVLIAAVQVRDDPITPLAFGACAAYVAHAAIDWDWEMPAVTATALLIGAALLVGARGDREIRFRGRHRAAFTVCVLAVSAFALVGLVGFAALSASTTARREGDFAEAAAQAQTAVRWLRWSPRPYVALGEVQRAVGADDAAARSFRSALRREDNEWVAWLRLAQVTKGIERERALSRAIALNPRSPEIRAFRRRGSAGS